MVSELPVIVPDWPAPASVRALCTTRAGGVSMPPWDTLNLGTHVGDEPASVRENRRRLSQFSGLHEHDFGWLNQVHGTAAVELPVAGVPEADASFTRRSGTACVVLTADCLPVLFCNSSGTFVASAHAGWRGLCHGVLEQVVANAGGADDLMVWLGPAIGPTVFEVGPEVREAFVQQAAPAASAFSGEGANPGHFLADLYLLARQRLGASGVQSIYGGDFCTLSDQHRFFSYRRDGQCGRMASLIWLDTTN